MKKFKYVLLAILSVFVFAFSACEKEEAKTPTTPPAPTTPTPTTPTTEEVPEPETTEEVPEPEPETPVNEYFNATFYDVDFCPTLASDRLSVLIEVIPKYHIYNLQIKVNLNWITTTYHTVTKTFEQAPAYQKISFTINSPNYKLSDGSRVLIDWYDFDVVGGIYDADIETFECELSVDKNNSEDAFASYNYSLSEDKISALIDIKPKINVYDLKITAKSGIDFGGNAYDHGQTNTKNIDFNPANYIISWRIFLPDYYIAQNVKLYNVCVNLKGSYRKQPEQNLTPTAEYWAQFK